LLQRFSACANNGIVMLFFYFSAIMVLSCSLQNYQTFSNISEANSSVPVRVLDLYTGDSGFKGQYLLF